MGLSVVHLNEQEQAFVQVVFRRGYEVRIHSAHMSDCSWARLVFMRFICYIVCTEEHPKSLETR